MRTFTGSASTSAAALTSVEKRATIEGMGEGNAELRRLNRAYRALGHLGAEIVRATSEPELLTAVCKTLVEVGGYELVWVGVADGTRVRPVAACGTEGARGYLDGIEVSVLDDALGRGPTGKALRLGQPVLSRDTREDPGFAPWRARALQHGLRSSLGLPLLSHGAAFGALTVYSALPDAFDDDERELLSRFCEGLSFGIEVLRTRKTLAYTQAQLRDANERSRFEILEQSPSAWVALAPDLRFLYINPQFAQLVGQAADALVGHSALELFPQHVGAPMERALRQVLETRTGVTIEEYTPRLDRWIECRFYPIDAGIAGAFNDVTERRRLQEGLRESELRFRQLADNIDDVFWLADIATRKILYVSSAYERVWGRGREALYASPQQLIAAIHPDDRERVAASLPHQIEGNWEAEYRVVRPDGSSRWLRARCYLVRAAEGRPARLAGVARDITDQRALEDQFRQAQKMEAVGQLAGGVAHDFNNLLTVILNYATFALEGLEAGKPVSREITEIHKAGERAAELTRQLLAFGRQQMLRPKVLDLNEELEEFQAMLRPLLGEHIDLVLRGAADLGAVYVDRNQIAQVVMNLAVNARDAMPRGGQLIFETANVQLDASVAAVAPGPYVRLTVSDTGSGMDAQTRERIFDPFFTTKALGKGTGLGLSTVFGIVKQSDGHITVESELDQGTTFKLYFPCSDRRAPVEPTPAARSSAPGGSETILLVEDHAQVRRLNGLILRQQGYTVLEASDGLAALEVSAQHRGTIALLLTDVVMPRLSGKELAERLAPLRPEMRVLYVSGFDEDSIVHDGVLEEGVAFLQKPMAPEALLEKIRAMLDAA